MHHSLKYEQCAEKLERQGAVKGKNFIFKRNLILLQGTTKNTILIARRKEKNKEKK